MVGLSLVIQIFNHEVSILAQNSNSKTFRLNFKNWSNSMYTLYQCLFFVIFDVVELVTIGLRSVVLHGNFQKPCAVQMVICHFGF
jgi:hypothetical protein